jgi:hypothetical protein
MTISQTIENGTAEEQTALVAYGKTRDILENLGFMWAVINYIKLANKTPVGNVPIAVAQIKGIIPFEFRGGANTMGKWIYDTYIDRKAALAVNIASEEIAALQKIAETRSSPFTPPDFADAYNRISKLLDRQAFLIPVCSLFVQR